jgi:ADP-ribose pyrophosphatase
MQPWKTTARESLLRLGEYVTVERHTVELPDGRVISEWPWLVMPEYANVVPVTEAGEVLCFRQTKYAIAGTSLAPVGGYIEPGENPLAAAQRELLEETGHEAPDWTSLGSYAVDGNRGAGTAHLFLARGARRVADVDTDDLEEQQLLSLSPQEIRSALAAGEFKVLVWATALALALLRMNE